MASKCFSVRNIAVAACVILVISAVVVGVVIATTSDDDVVRTFTVDHVTNTFLMDGSAFRYVAGSFHYFRALQEAWPARLKTMKEAGLNVVDTYVEWALHNPYDGEYTWEGIADLENFIELAQAEGFYVILRPGPYICAERDNGGLPHWLFTKHPNIQMRTNDTNYIEEVAKWYAELMPRMQKYLYGNGGPIIMVQVENEYGVFYACDHDYLNWLRDETEKYVEGKALLFTTDIPNDLMSCGKIDGVFATTDFGIDRIHEIDNIWKMLREIQPTGPLVNSEFYPGWLTHWQEENQRRDGALVASSLRTMLEYGASVNFYMFFGGTNFGFTAGANDFGWAAYTADITSYDYDAVMDEAGGVTDKYMLVREVISDFLTVPEFLNNSASARIAYGQVEFKPIATLLSSTARAALTKGSPVVASRPQSFEELNQYSGLVLYETALPTLVIDPSLVTVEGLRDRAFVFVDQQFVGTLSRENAIYSVPVSKGWGSTLQILVENQGRINFNVANDTKGIDAVTIQSADGEHDELSNWTSTSLPLESLQVDVLVEQYKNGLVPELSEDSSSGILRNGPVMYYGEFSVTELGDSYLNPDGWGKGVVYLNGFNLGRYWPLAGPQITLYVPKEALRLGTNELVVLEYQRVKRAGDANAPVMQLDSSAQLDA